MSDRLILEIEVPDFNVDGTLENIEAFGGDVTVLDVVREEWMRDEVGVTFVTLPGEKCMNYELEIETRTCRIVGARIEQEGSSCLPPSPSFFASVTGMEQLAAAEARAERAERQRDRAIEALRNGMECGETVAIRAWCACVLARIEKNA